MRRALKKGREGERGSALVIAILVIVILTLLGVSYVLMAETENRIAQNEKLSAQALYFAEGGARQVKRWFDRPYSTWNLANPPVSIVDRTLRQLDTDGAGPNVPFAQDGSSSAPRYKQGVDFNGDGNDDLFEKPYRGTLAHTLLGTADGPDMRIDENYSSQAKTFLGVLSERLLSNFPAPGAGIRARITRIDIFAPPYLDIGGAWTRYGMGTVAVTAVIVRNQGGTEQVLASRTIRAVLNETPYPGPSGPLHSCSLLETNGDLEAFWGAVQAVGWADPSNNHTKIPASLARDLPLTPKIDRLLYWNDDAMFAAYKDKIEDQSGGLEIEDPWYRFMSAQAINNPPICGPATGVNDPQRCPFDWDGVSDLGAEQQPLHTGGVEGSHSNVFQNTPVVTCPDFDYETWKAVATSGGSDVHYYAWDNGDAFRENGFGPARPIREIIDNQEGLFFFDTKDGAPPTDADNDGEYENLTPSIQIAGGTWGFRGFMYLNAEHFQSRGATGRNATVTVPGEPFQDKDGDGMRDPGENWINLNFNDIDDFGDTFRGDDDDNFGGSVTYNAIGPTFTDTVNLWGILYSNGRVSPTGNARYFGSVIAKSGVGDTSPAAGTAEFYWDESILRDWPPASWDLPRVVITRWETDF
jgi:hypothetical protein